MLCENINGLYKKINAFSLFEGQHRIIDKQQKKGPFLERRHFSLVGGHVSI